MERGNFLLPISTADGWLDHEKLTAASVALEFHAAHPNKLHCVEEGRGQRLKHGSHFRCGHTACR
jgi:hypothetical protein